MTTFNTGNPVPSTDARDLSDNAENFDSATNSNSDTWTDRLGVIQDTLQGRLKKLGYAAPVVYDAGISFTVSDNVKTVDEGGIIYAPLPSALPFTTSGVWIGDDDSRFFVIQTSAEAEEAPNYNFENVADMVAGLTIPYSVGDILSAKSIDLAGVESFDYLVYDGSTNVPWREATATELVSSADRTAYVLTGGLIAVQIPSDDWWATFNAQKVSMLNAEILYSETAPNIVCVGDSVTEGYDDTSGDIIPNNVRASVLGAATVAPLQYPAQLKYWSTEYAGSLRVGDVKNWGYSGDTVVTSYDRFDSLGNPNSDVAILMFGINDNTSQESLAEFIRNYIRLIRKYQYFGCGVILMTATEEKGGTRPDTNNFRLAMRQISKVTGCPLIDTVNMTNGDVDSLYSDTSHFTAAGYNMIALRVMAALVNIQIIDDQDGRHLVKSGEVLKSMAPSGISALPAGSTSIVGGSVLADKTTRFLNTGESTAVYQYFEQDVTNLRLFGTMGNVTVTIDGGLDYNYGPYGDQTRFNKLVTYTGTSSTDSRLGQVLGKGWHVIHIYQNSGTSFLNGLYFETVGALGFKTDTLRSYSFQLGSPGSPTSTHNYTIPASILKKLKAGNRTDDWFFTQPSIKIICRTDGPDANLIGTGTKVYVLQGNSNAKLLSETLEVAERSYIEVSAVSWTDGKEENDMTIITSFPSSLYGRITLTVED